MEFKMKRQDWTFFLICLALGIVAEKSFLHGKIGLSYLLFITCFYGVFFWRFRSFDFTNKKLGMLMIASIWLLAASFLLSSNMTLYILNILVIPLFVLIHLVLVTYPLQNEWHKWRFVQKLFLTTGAAAVYVGRFLMYGPKLASKGIEEKTIAVLKRILIGLAISVPLLFVIINLLISADQHFGQVISTFPMWLTGLRIEEEVIRIAATFFFTLAIFGLLQILRKKRVISEPAAEKGKQVSWDSIVSMTVLILLNIVYLLFVIVQFKYFFSMTLQGGYTYAELARRGFFELLFVTMLNLLIISSTVSFVEMGTKAVKLSVRGLLTLLVFFSGIMLYSAFIRLFMYEEAYGFTFARVLAHSFMIFLMVVLGYSLIRIWLERLSLVRFYIISSIIYYTMINTLQLDEFVVNQNLERYKETGKIDIYYLNSLSYDGVAGLVELYRLNPEIPRLKVLLQERKEEALLSDVPWNSLNLSRWNAERILRDTTLE